MNPFQYRRADSASAAVESIPANGMFLAGGTNLIDLMKYDVEHPATLVDINRAGLDAIEPLSNGGLRLGALARNSDTANHPMVRDKYPLLSQAILSGASPQLRNMATNGGNLLQRTRCPYFMDPGFAQCNKRAPGSGCGAIGGFNRVHAIFGASERCIAVHPSDMCIALAALEATVRVQSREGERTIAFTDFHRLPGETPQFDTNLKHGELVLSIDLPPSRHASHSHYVKVRDRASYEFALVSAAVALDIEQGTVRDARIAMGGVAHKPWRAAAAEKELVGHPPDAERFARAATAAAAGARPHRENAFKVELAKNAVLRALTTAGGLA